MYAAWQYHAKKKIKIKTEYIFTMQTENKIIR